MNKAVCSAHKVSQMALENTFSTLFSFQSLDFLIDWDLWWFTVVVFVVVNLSFFHALIRVLCPL